LVQVAPVSATPAGLTRSSWNTHPGYRTVPTWRPSTLAIHREGGPERGG
jgi:hypothetical protein